MGSIYSYFGYTDVPIEEKSNRPKRIYNWKRSTKRPESEQYIKIINATESTGIDLTVTKKFPPVYDQGQIGSCSAQALSCAFGYDYLNSNTQDDKENVFNPSRLYLYYMERKKENDIPDDNGAIISDGIWCLQNNGVCSEESWPYDITKFAKKPNSFCDHEASEHKLISCKAVNQQQKDIETCLANGFPVVFGFVVYPEIESLNASSNYILPLPIPGEQSIGGHAVLIVGFNTEKKLFKIRNSWGIDWGEQGHFYIPYDYILNPNLADDFWIMTQVESFK